MSDISCENLNEILIDKIINEITPKQLDDCSKNGITLKNVSEHFLIEETLGILAISASGKHCGQIILAYGHAGMPEKGEGISRKIIDNLKPEEIPQPRRRRERPNMMTDTFNTINELEELNKNLNNLNNLKESKLEVFEDQDSDDDRF